MRSGICPAWRSFITRVEGIVILTRSLSSQVMMHTKTHRPSTISWLDVFLLSHFFLSSLTWWRDNLPCAVVSDDGSENSGEIITIIRQFFSLIRNCLRRLIVRSASKDGSFQTCTDCKPPARSWCWHFYTFPDSFTPTIKLMVSVSQQLYAWASAALSKSLGYVSTVISGVVVAAVRFDWLGVGFYVLKEKHHDADRSF